jgi:addiction module RelB/DinJ family antitoxin
MAGDGVLSFGSGVRRSFRKGLGKLDGRGIFEHICVMKSHSTTLLRARVGTDRYQKAEKVFDRLGLKTTDAINLFFAQVALREDLPFVVTAHPERLLSDEQQAMAWSEALGEY